MSQTLIYPMEEKYQEYIIDESKYEGSADSISFPETEEEAAAVVRALAQEEVPITIQGGKTGIVGGAVPKGGHIMNLSAMKKCVEWGEAEDGTCWITVEPGMNLMELEAEISRAFRKSPVFWPPKPTETSATVGGILASNARGMNGCRYGDSRQYVTSIHLLLDNGEIREITRGERSLSADGREIDELDMVLGGEGIYGAITQATLILLPKPQDVWGISFFFENKESALAFGQGTKDLEEVQGACLEAVEYLDRNTIDLIEGRKAVMTKIKDLPDVEERYQAMVYVELAGEEDPIEELAGLLMELAVECESDPDEAWAVSGEAEVEKMHAFRHGAAETANLHIEEVRRSDSRITKLGTDIALDRQNLGQVVTAYEEGLDKEGLKGCIFGHVTDNHMHVNILPENYEEYQRGKALIESWSRQFAQAGGVVTSEHGIGKTKRGLANLALSREMQERMLSLREELNPKNIWNRGNIFEE